MNTGLIDMLDPKSGTFWSGALMFLLGALAAVAPDTASNVFHFNGDPATMMLGGIAIVRARLAIKKNGKEV